MAPEKSTDDLEDKPPTGGYAKTSMIVRIELPALSKAVQVHFALEPSKSKRVLDGLSDFVRDIPRKWNDELLDFDPDSSEKQLDSFRQGALADLDSWNTKVKAAEEWKRKVDNAAANMNKMRDAYYRELFHLREQVYRQEKAKKEGAAFHPTYALHFDPSEYHVEDEVRRAVAAKMALLEQEFQTKHDAQEVRHGARVKSLNEQLVVSKMSLSRKEKLLEKLKLKHGWDNQQLKEMLEAQKIDEEQMRAKIEAKAQQAEQLAAVAFQELSSTKQEDSDDDEVQNLRGFLERKHGSIKEAIAQIRQASDVDARMGLAEFQTWTEQIGYGSETKRAFVRFCGASPFTSLKEIIDRLARPPPVKKSVSGTMAASTRRRSACAELEGVRHASDDLGIASEPLGSARRRSIDSAISASSPSRRVTRRATMAMGTLGKIVEDGPTMDMPIDPTIIGSDSDSDLMSDIGSEMSDFSDLRSASRVSGAKSESVHRMRQVPGRPAGRRRMVSSEVATDVTFASGTEAAFSSTNPLVRKDTADAGCEARPYEASFGKRPLKTRAVQSQIDGTMLEKAMQVITDVGVENLDEARQSFANGPTTSRSGARGLNCRSSRIGSSRTSSADLDAAGFDQDDYAGASTKAARTRSSAADDEGDACQVEEGPHADSEEDPATETDEVPLSPSAAQAAGEHGRAVPPRHRRPRGLQDHAARGGVGAAALGPVGGGGGEPGACEGEGADGGPSAVSTYAGLSELELAERSTFGSAPPRRGATPAFRDAATSPVGGGGLAEGGAQAFGGLARGFFGDGADAGLGGAPAGDPSSSGAQADRAPPMPEGKGSGEAQWPGAASDVDPGAAPDDGRDSLGVAAGARRELRERQAALRTTRINGDDLPEAGPGSRTEPVSRALRNLRRKETGRDFLTDHVQGLSGPTLPVPAKKVLKTGAEGPPQPLDEEEEDDAADQGRLSFQRTVAVTAKKKEGVDSLQRLSQGAKRATRALFPSELAHASASERPQEASELDEAALAPGWSGLVPAFSSRAAAAERQSTPGMDRQMSERSADSNWKEDALRVAAPGSARAASSFSRQTPQVFKTLSARGPAQKSPSKEVPSKEVVFSAEAGERRTEPVLRGARSLQLPQERRRPAAGRASEDLSGPTGPRRAGHAAASDGGGDSAGSDCDSLPDTGCMVDVLMDKPHAKVPRGIPPGVASTRLRRLRGVPAAGDAEGGLLPPVGSSPRRPPGQAAAANKMLDLPDSAGVECRVSLSGVASQAMGRISFRRTTGNMFHKPEKQETDAGKTRGTALPDVSRQKKPVFLADKLEVPAGPSALSASPASSSSRRRESTEDPDDIPERVTFSGVFPGRDTSSSRRPTGSTGIASTDSSALRQGRGASSAAPKRVMVELAAV